MKRDINLRILSVKNVGLYYTVNNLPGFLDAQNANLFVMYANARLQIKFEQTKSMAPIFDLIISSGSMFDLIQLLNLMSKSNTSSKLLVHYVNYLSLHHQMSSEFDGIHSIRFSRCIHKIDHNSYN
jgi:hypothetical protein